MNKRFRNIALLGLGLLLSPLAQAGNPDRVGQAGVSQLRVQPWARNAGMGNADIGGTRGVEATSLNVAGLANISSTEFMFTNITWLGNDAGLHINNFGLAQKIGTDDVLGFTVSSWSLGDINRTTVAQPENTLGTYNISMTGIGIHYAHKFSNAISTGFSLRYISQGTENVSSSGFALDAGIQYHAARADRVKLGIALRNVGPAMNFSGSGISVRGVRDGSEYSSTLENRNNDYEMPTLLQMGGSYDFFFDSTVTNHVLTVAASFTSNSFDADQGHIGLQYAFRKLVFLRGGYTYQNGIFKNDRTTAYNGPSAGAGVSIPFGKDGLKRFGIDYSYQSSGIFNGTHIFGARLAL